MSNMYGAQFWNCVRHAALYFGRDWAGGSLCRRCLQEEWDATGVYVREVLWATWIMLNVEGMSETVQLLPLGATRLTKGNVYDKLRTSKKERIRKLGWWFLKCIKWTVNKSSQYMVSSLPLFLFIYGRNKKRNWACLKVCGEEGKGHNCLKKQSRQRETRAEKRYCSRRLPLQSIPLHIRATHLCRHFKVVVVGVVFLAALTITSH